MERNPNLRPFVLTRAYFFGAQKYGAFWTGDNREGFPELAHTVSMLLSAGVSGMPFGGSDLPSFYGNQTEHTWVASYQLGVFMPFFRAHSHQKFKSREPWFQSIRVQKAIKSAIHLRYTLFHYLYTTFYFSTQSGAPIVRPMWQEFPKDERTFALDM